MFRLAAVVGGLVAAAAAGFAVQQGWESGIVWAEPKVVAPGDAPGAPPADAVVLFDGKDLSKWKNGDKWVVKDGYAVVKNTDITTKDSFGDYQLHLEFATPEVVKGSGQGRGNSGVFLSNRYEVQVLDSFGNKTYFDGMCAALYKQQPPMVNASRGPGQWQTYDIVYEAPRFGGDKKLVKPGYVTVIHNGVVVHNHYELQGNTWFDKAPAYEPHPVKQPIRLQNHGDPVKYRNIWLREIAPIEGKKPAPKS
ncbi:DUF1080 domain-containing protein [bacterium]|nr:DUF1080 domain-containing protein [bacterium]